MAGWRDRLEKLRRRFDDLVKDIEGLLQPERELVPVPVRVRRPEEPRR